MNRLNWLFTLSSLLVVLVTVERASGATRVILEPHAFLSLHQLLETLIEILLTIVIAGLLYWELSRRNVSFSRRSAIGLFIVFLVGVYITGAGQGLHEMASYLLGSRCDVDHPVGNLCGGLFIDEAYTGNIMFFVGGFLSTGTLLIVERLNPNGTFTRRQAAPMAINAVVYASTVLAYAGFDRVLVGLGYTLATLVFTLVVFLPVRRRVLEFPFITYTLIVYGLGAAASLVAQVVR